MRGIIYNATYLSKGLTEPTFNIHLKIGLFFLKNLHFNQKFLEFNIKNTINQFKSVKV